MRPLAIIGLALGVAAPILLLLPLILMPLGGEDYMQVGWAFFFFTVPAGYLLAIAGAVLEIIAASISLNRGVRPKAIAITGIALVGSGLVIEPLGILGFISGWGEIPSATLLGLGIAVSIAGIVMCAISGLRRPRWG